MTDLAQVNGSFPAGHAPFSGLTKVLVFFFFLNRKCLGAAFLWGK